MLSLLDRTGARVRPNEPNTVRFELDLPRLGEELKTSPGYQILRAVARGEVDLSPRERSPWMA